MAHPLQRYLEEHELSHVAIAARSGVARSTITKVLSGSRKRFSPEAARKLVKATGGAVTLEELLGLPPAPAARVAG